MKHSSKSTASSSPRAERRKQIVASLSDKAYRDAFVRQTIEVGLPFQIRGMRVARDKSQKELGKMLGKPQSVVSRFENPGYGRFTLNTLLEIASVFDVGLLVTFVPFSELASRVSGLTSESMQVPEFDADTMLDPSCLSSSTNVVSLVECELTQVGAADQSEILVWDERGARPAHITRTDRPILHSGGYFSG